MTTNTTAASIHAAPADFDDDNNNTQADPNDNVFLSSPGVVRRLSHAELEDLRLAFQLLDTSKSGEVAVGELQELLHEMLQDDGETSTNNNNNNNNNSASTQRRHDAHLLQLYQRLQTLAPDDKLSQHDFIQLVTTPTTTTAASHDDDDDASTPHVISMANAFSLFSNGKDYIEMADLQRVSTELGETMSLADLQDMLQVAARVSDNDNNPLSTRVTRAQFERLLNQQLFS